MIISAITMPMAQNWIMWVRLLSQVSVLFMISVTQFPNSAVHTLHGAPNKTTVLFGSATKLR